MEFHSIAKGPPVTELMSQAHQRRRRWAILGLKVWTLCLCAYLGVFALMVLGVATDVGFGNRYEPILSGLIFSWLGLAASQFVCFWLVRRATSAPDPFVVAAMAAVPLLSLVIGPTIVQQAARDLGDQGHRPKLGNLAVWAWVTPVAAIALCWFLSIVLTAARADAANLLVLIVTMVNVLLVPSILRLIIAFRLRRSLMEWDISLVAKSARASANVSAAG